MIRIQHTRIPLILFSLFALACATPAFGIDVNGDGLEDVGVVYNDRAVFFDTSGAELHTLLLPDDASLAKASRVFAVQHEGAPALLFVTEKTSKRSSTATAKLVANSQIVAELDFGRTDQSTLIFSDVDADGNSDLLATNVRKGDLEVSSNLATLVPIQASKVLRGNSDHALTRMAGTPALLSLSQGKVGSTRKRSRKRSKQSKSVATMIPAGTQSTPAAIPKLQGNLFGFENTAAILDVRAKRKKTAIAAVGLEGQGIHRYSANPTPDVVIPGKFVANGSELQVALIRGLSVSIVDMVTQAVLAEFDISANVFSGGTGSGSGSSGGGSIGGGGSAGGGSGGGSLPGAGDAEALRLMTELEQLMANTFLLASNPQGFAARLGQLLSDLGDVLDSGTVSAQVENEIMERLSAFGSLSLPRSLPQTRSANVPFAILQPAILKAAKALNANGSPAVCSVVTSGESGTVYKPESDSNGLPVFLSPSQFGPSSQAYSTKGKVLFSLKSTGYANGGRLHLRFPQRPAGSFWIVDPDRRICLKVPNGHRRYER